MITIEETIRSKRQYRKMRRWYLAQGFTLTRLKGCNILVARRDKPLRKRT